MADDPGKTGAVVVNQDAFTACLQGDCTALNHLLTTPQRYFPPISAYPSPTSLQRMGGLELEMLLINPVTGELAAAGQPLWEDLTRHNSPEATFTREASTYAVEINIAPFPIAGAGFALLRQRLEAALATLRRVAARYGLACLGVGMAPSTRLEQLGPHAIPDVARYHLLNEVLMRYNVNRPVRLQGPTEQVDFLAESVALVGAGTSAQFHLMGDYDSFPELFNAAQAITGLMVGLAAHSPFFNGLALAHETRLLTFQAFTDTRTPQECQRGVPARVDVGAGWVRSAFEALTRGVATHHPLVPNVEGLADSVRQLALGQTPSLLALRRSQGTQWEHNRALFCTTGADQPVSGGFLRVETRAMASGSTPDVWANCVFSAGLMHSLASDPVPVAEQFHFDHVRRTVKEAIAQGMGANVWWPQLGQMPLPQVVTQVCLPLARQGLADLQVSPSLAHAALDIIEQRCRTQVNGASWSLRVVEQLQARGSSRTAALAELTRLTARHQASSTASPVHTWPLPTSGVVARPKVGGRGPVVGLPAPTAPSRGAVGFPAVAHWRA